MELPDLQSHRRGLRVRAGHGLLHPGSAATPRPGTQSRRTNADATTEEIALYEYRAKVASIYDADTLRLDVDCGFSVWLHRVAFRLAGIDAPELGTPGGIEARDWLRALLPVGSDLIAITYKDKGDKYGRWLADLYLPGDTVNSINQQLIDAGHAKLYDGGARA